MKTIIRFILLLLTGLVARAGDITPGYTWVNLESVNATKMNSFLTAASVNSTFYTSRSSLTALAGTEIALVYDGTYFKKITMASLFGRTNIITDTAVVTSLSTNDVFSVVSAGALGQITLTNAAVSLSPWIRLSSLSGWPSLSAWGTLDPASTNAQPYFPVFGTNGTLKSTSFTNLIAGAVPILGTNLLVPYVWNQMWRPDLVFSTNGFPTNVWGFTTATAITNTYFGTNNLTFTNNLSYPALTNSDTFPIMSIKQRTNTTVTLEALAAFVTGSINTNSYAGTSTNTSLAFNREVFTHSLGVKPSQVRGVLLCVTNEGVFIAGDEVDYASIYNSGATTPFSITANATNITVAQFYYPGQAGSTTTTATNSIAAHTFSTTAWRFKVYAKP